MEADDPQQAGPGTVLITGGGGLIGTALAAALLRDGNAVERTSRRELDVRDARAVRDRVVALEPRVIFHLAGDSDLARCARDPDMAAELHVGGTRNVLDAAARLAQPPAFVCASTRHVYDHDAEAGPIGERGTFVTTPGYGETRARADLLVMASRDVPAASLRLTNVYGPGDPRSGRIVPVIESSIRHRRPIELLAGSSRQLELLHVDDAVAAYLALAAALVAGRRGVAGSAFNAGSGVATTAGELVATAQESAGTALPVRFGAGHEAARPLRLLESSALHSATGWKPRVALGDGLAGVVAGTGAQHPTI